MSERQLKIFTNLEEVLAEAMSQCKSIRGIQRQTGLSVNLITAYLKAHGKHPGSIRRLGNAA